MLKAHYGRWCRDRAQRERSTVRVFDIFEVVIKSKSFKKSSIQEWLKLQNDYTLLMMLLWMLTRYQWEKRGDLNTHRHIKKKCITKWLHLYFSGQIKTVCIKNRFILANESKVFPRQINQDKKISNKGSEFTCVVLRCVWVLCCGRHSRHCDATAQMHPGYSQADVTSTTKLRFKQRHKSWRIFVYFNVSKTIDIGLFTCR